MKLEAVIIIYSDTDEETLVIITNSELEHKNLYLAIHSDYPFFRKNFDPKIKFITTGYILNHNKMVWNKELISLYP